MTDIRDSQLSVVVAAQGGGDIRVSQMAVVVAAQTENASEIRTSQMAAVSPAIASTDIRISQLVAYAVCWEPPAIPRLVPRRLPLYIFKGKGRYIQS